MFNKNDFINWNLQAQRRDPENMDYISSSSNPMKQIRKVANIENTNEANEAIEELDEAWGLALKGLQGLGRVALRGKGALSALKSGVGKAAGKVKGVGSKGASKGAETTAQTSTQTATRATDAAKLGGRPAVRGTSRRSLEASPSDVSRLNTNVAAKAAAKKQAAAVAAKRQKVEKFQRETARLAQKKKGIPVSQGNVSSKVIKRKEYNPRTTPKTTTTTAPTTAPTTATTTGVKGAIAGAKTKLTKWSANQNKLGDRIVKGAAKKAAKFARTKTGKVIIGGAIARKALSDAAASSREKTWYPGMKQEESTNHHGNKRLDELISVLGRDGMKSNRAYLGGLKNAYTGAKATNYDMKRKIVNLDRMGRDSQPRHSDGVNPDQPKPKKKLSVFARAKAQLNKVKDTVKAARGMGPIN
jgi:hypothetical protein